MREAIRANQRPITEANQRPSEAISGHQWSSVIFPPHLRQPRLAFPPDRLEPLMMRLVSRLAGFVSGATSLLDLRRDRRAYMQDALVALVALRP